MRLKYNQYSLSQGVRKIKTKTALVLSAVMLAIGSGGGLSLAVFGTSHAESDQTVVVTQNDLTNVPDTSHWFMYNDSTDTIDNTLGSFVVGPSTPTNGVGSVEFTLGADPDDRKNIATYQFAGTRLADVTELSYSAYSHSGVAGANESPYFNFNVDFDGSDASNTWQKRLVYVPSANMATVPQDQWNNFDMIDNDNALWTWSGYEANGNKWMDGNTNRYRSLSDLLSVYPNMSVLSTDSWLGIRVGEPGPTGYVGNVDAFTIGTAEGTTTFDFEPVVAHGEITSPTAGQHVSGTLNLAATYQDNETTNPDGVQWAVREGTCAAGTSTVFGNVDGHSDEFTWTGNDFSSTLDVRNVTPGEYCFIFNPVDDPGQPNVRETQTFYIDQYYAQAKTDCKNGGWMTLHDENDGSFKNQGQCVAYVNHNDQVGKDDDHARNR